MFKNNCCYQEPYIETKADIQTKNTTIKAESYCNSEIVSDKALGSEASIQPPLFKKGSTQLQRQMSPPAPTPTPLYYLHVLKMSCNQR